MFRNGVYARNFQKCYLLCDLLMRQERGTDCVDNFEYQPKHWLLWELDLDRDKDYKYFTLTILYIILVVARGFPRRKPNRILGKMPEDKMLQNKMSENGKPDT